MVNGMRWVVAGGGTGGHVTPALALAERIAARGDSVLMLGSERGLETRLVPQAGFELVALASRQVMGRGIAGRAAAALALMRACVGARAALRRFEAQLVVSVGGYAAMPAVVAAALLRLPLALVEPNAVPGRANRWSARLAKRIFVQFEEAGQVFGRSGDRGRILATGIPLRTALVESFADAPARGAPSTPLRVLVFGGSQGARQINDALIEAAPNLPPGAYTFFHQTGEADRERVEAAYASAGTSAQVVAFEPDMPQRYRWADVAVCRAGALTVAELALAALPALLVPYPYAADDHQTANARALTEAGAARRLDPSSLSGAQIACELEALRDRPEQLREMGVRAGKLARPEAAERIVDECAALVAEA
jgi:UDP-N-acetylglucosamine--N-acetylmuramyl-(pentapeptide) pyrophosphoryl-undecaprenol N-acetylglucosamine transferase